MIDIKTTVMYTSGNPTLVILDYFLDTSSFQKNEFVNEDSIRYCNFHIFLLFVFLLKCLELWEENISKLASIFKKLSINNIATLSQKEMNAIT